MNCRLMFLSISRRRSSEVWGRESLIFLPVIIERGALSSSSLSPLSLWTSVASEALDEEEEEGEESEWWWCFRFLCLCFFSFLDVFFWWEEEEDSFFSFFSFFFYNTETSHFSDELWNADIENLPSLVFSLSSYSFSSDPHLLYPNENLFSCDQAPLPLLIHCSSFLRKFKQQTKTMIFNFSWFHARIEKIPYRN